MHIEMMDKHNLESSFQTFNRASRIQLSTKRDSTEYSCILAQQKAMVNRCVDNPKMIRHLWIVPSQLTKRSQLNATVFPRMWSY